jgi:glycine/D-amino acid oxidase-like deaminating enzyme
MDLRSGVPFWPQRNGIVATWPPLERDEKCDVAIIGAGVTGALVAFHLVREGVDVVVLDRRDAASGSTAASTALLLAETDTELRDLVGSVGVDDAVRAYRLGRRAIDDIEAVTRDLGDPCDFARRSSIYLASKPSHAKRLREEAALRRRHGIEVEYLERADLDTLGAPDAPAALLSTGGEIDPYRFTERLLQSVRSAGARVYDRTRVTAVRPDGTGVTLETDRGPRVRCRRVVYATGYESAEYFDDDPAELQSSFVIASEPFERAPWPGDHLIWETARPYLYMRATADRRAIVGGEDVPFSTAHKRDRLVEKKAEALAKKFEALFPDRKLEVAYAWAGTFGTTPDGLPRIGEAPGRPHAYFALGYGGNGITFGAIAARLLTDAYLGRHNPDAWAFRVDR